MSPELAPTAPPPPKAPACVPDQSFNGILDVPEASAATEVELTPGVRELLVVSDSGQKGAALLYKLPNGPARKLTLPLDPKTGDDSEGLAWRNGRLYVLTSSGAVEEMAPDGHGGLTRTGPAYPIGDPPLSCPDLADGNCGKNFEGLCLRGASHSGRCVGYAASKAENALYCLVFERDPGSARERLVVDHILQPIHLTSLAKHALSDCAFGSEDGPAADRLLVGTNLYGGSTLYVVDEKTGQLAPIDIGGLPNIEAIAVDHTGALYQAMDDNGTPSPALRAACTW